MSIRKRIRAALEGTHDPSPAAVAAVVLDALPDEELRPALAQALPYLVRDEIRKERMRSIGTPPSEWAPRPDTGRPRPADQKTWEEQATPKDVTKLREAGRKSAQVNAERRERESALLRTPVSVGGDWKALGDCTAADLRLIASHHRKHAAENERRARGYERLADTMERAGAKHVREVVGDGVREAFAA